MKTINLIKNLSKIVNIVYGETLSDREFLELANSLAKEYSTNSSYSVGEFCKHDLSLYVCKVEIINGEAWNSSHWELVQSNRPSTLENTEWIFNDRINTHTINPDVYNISGYVLTNTPELFTSIEFYLDGNYVDLYLEEADYPLYDDSRLDNPWINYGSGCRDIVINGGSDADNEDLIEWFLYNATRIA